MREKSINKLRLFCDSCSGQNKNYSVLLGLQNLCKKHKIDFEWFFPIRSHSYMPPDRAFGHVTRMLKKVQLILSPEKYDEFFRKVGTLFIVGEEVKVFNYKAIVDRILKVIIYLYFVQKPSIFSSSFYLLIKFTLVLRVTGERRIQYIGS